MICQTSMCFTECTNTQVVWMLHWLGVLQFPRNWRKTVAQEPGTLTWTTYNTLLSRHCGTSVSYILPTELITEDFTFLLYILRSKSQAQRRLTEEVGNEKGASLRCSYRGSEMEERERKINAVLLNTWGHANVQGVVCTSWHDFGEIPVSMICSFTPKNTYIHSSSPSIPICKAVKTNSLYLLGQLRSHTKYSVLYEAPSKRCNLGEFFCANKRTGHILNSQPQSVIFQPGCYTRYFCVAVIKHHVQTWIIEDSIYFDLWFQIKESHHGGEAWQQAVDIVTEAESCMITFAWSTGQTESELRL